jgi:hypothetical protein
MYLCAYICLIISCQDPFGDVLKGVMNAIHIHAELNPTCDLGTQNYEQWVVQKEQNGEGSHLFSCSFVLEGY